MFTNKLTNNKLPASRVAAGTAHPFHLSILLPLTAIAAAPPTARSLDAAARHALDCAGPGAGGQRQASVASHELLVGCQVWLNLHQQWAAGAVGGCRGRPSRARQQSDQPSDRLLCKWLNWSRPIEQAS